MTDIVVLPVDDRVDLDRLESIVDRHREGFLAVAAALCEIRDRKLYRQTAPTFERYVKARFGFSADYGRKLLRSAERVRAAAELLPPENRDNCLALAEGAAREVVDLPVDQAAEVLATATSKARDEGRSSPSRQDVRAARGLPPRSDRRSLSIPERTKFAEQLEESGSSCSVAAAFQRFNVMLDTAAETHGWGPEEWQHVGRALLNLRWDLFVEGKVPDAHPFGSASGMLRHQLKRSDEDFRTSYTGLRAELTDLGEAVAAYRTRARDLGLEQAVVTSDGLGYGRVGRGSERNSAPFGPRRTEPGVEEPKSEVVEDAQPEPAPEERRATVGYFCGASAPKGEPVEHETECPTRNACPTCKEPEGSGHAEGCAALVKPGSFWRSRTARDHVLVVDRVEGDAAVVRFRHDPKLEQKTTVGKILEKLSLVSNPSTKPRKALPGNTKGRPLERPVEVKQRRPKGSASRSAREAALRQREVFHA